MGVDFGWEGSPTTFGSLIQFVFSSRKKRPFLVFMSTVEAGGLQGDKVSAIQKRHMVESDTSERKQHSRLSRIVEACCTSNNDNQWPGGTGKIS